MNITKQILKKIDNDLNINENYKIKDFATDSETIKYLFQESIKKTTKQCLKH